MYAGLKTPGVKNEVGYMEPQCGCAYDVARLPEVLPHPSKPKQTGKRARISAPIRWPTALHLTSHIFRG